MTTFRAPYRRAALAAALLLAAGPALLAGRPATAARGVFLTGLRSWSAPASTRVVFDFSAPVTPVAPDSGRTRALVVSLPDQPLARSPGVPEVLAVRDGLVDSVVVVTERRSARLQVWLRDDAPFRVFTLRAEDDKPFRLVVDLARPGAAPPAAAAPRAGVPAAAPRAKRELLVAVDAGHGGQDTGARGVGGVLEKTVNLATARALAEELARVPGLRVLLIREDDTFMPLRERYRIAERAKADLFISLHANSTPRRGSGRGSEVFFLSLRGASDQATQDLADLENAADQVGGVPERAEDDLVSILYDVKRASVLRQSQLLAETLLDHLTQDRRLEGRGVKQAGFVVLKSVEFPSVLVETAFINNAAEARLLASAEFQRQIARQLTEGVRTYLEKARIGYEGARHAEPGEGGGAGQGGAKH
jgi:N-acetylmuramoyl-L-alanine amidase